MPIYTIFVVYLDQIFCCKIIFYPTRQACNGLISDQANLRRQASRGGWPMNSQSANFPFAVTHFSLFLVYRAALELVLIEKV